ncbi:hypothetical protein A1Q1_05972 [Trichosporon asahii var. asahii CBS 2479]|uniref:Uncharacterized protein n=1 Tax=Trichosporon asahii var. asahii (strain ATCC 90039 / CBS 2479 / JCM 2466 / KCTC 7840 / NBRC 103889/ NCYC 2677 / UAMH 7654) TaxID=1186058 RepID=J5SGN0_TRIAS|nr:hypothetical protein A1Q1_05972 [Trichosporon asahii var. asahii CBS 2479]EJT45526.1 hypothetical protein A1Q1_05972 [Trichosporon asahii var. asahii CBS 2479]
MVEESPHLRAQRLAHQVWQLPHFRLSVFERLVTLRKRKSKFAGDDASLKQYLTLDKASFREVAMLLYPCIDLDSFPWDCPSQERKRLYAAGVKTLRATGCLPLCGKWEFGDLLDYFPNVQQIYFNASGVRWSREIRKTDGGAMARFNQFTINQTLKAQDGVIAPPQPFHAPLNVEYERKKLGIPTLSITWTMYEGDDFSLFARAAGPEVKNLHLNLFPAVENLSTALNRVMDGLQDDLLPGLDNLLIWVHFSFTILPELQDDGPTEFPEWLSNTMPANLDHIQLFLVCDNEENDDDWSDYEPPTVDDIRDDVLKALPISWLRNVRIKFGESFPLRVEVLRDFGDGLEDWDEPFDEALDHALFAPVTVNRSTQTVGQCTCVCTARFSNMPIDVHQPRAQQLAHRVWKLPHVRLSVFEFLATLLEDKRPYRHRKTNSGLLQFLTLDKDSFPEVAILLYTSIDLDAFPWNCPSEDRKQLYAAGVRFVDATGCLPLCVQWDFPGMLDYFHRVKRIRFNSTDVCWSRHADNSNNFQVALMPKVQDGAVISTHIFHPLPNLEYNTLYNFRPSRQPVKLRPYKRKRHGEIELPDIFLLPFEELDADRAFSKQGHWYTILGQRKKLGIPTHSITWTALEGDDLSKLTRVAGPDLQELVLHLHIEREGISTVLNSIMSSVRDDWLLGLENLIVYVHFDRYVAPEVADHGDTFIPDWITNEMPANLEFILLVLAVDMDGPEYTGEPFDYDSITPCQDPEPILEALPLSWIRNARIAFGDEINLCVDVLRDIGGGLDDWNEPHFKDKLEHALYGPLTLDQSTQTVGQCTCDQSG